MVFAVGVVIFFHWGEVELAVLVGIEAEGASSVGHIEFCAAEVLQVLGGEAEGVEIAAHQVWREGEFCAFRLAEGEACVGQVFCFSEIGVVHQGAIEVHARDDGVVEFRIAEVQLG